MRVVNFLEKKFESIFDEKAFGFLLLCQSLSSENIDSVLLVQACRLLIQNRHNSLTESNGFRASSVPLLYFGSLDRLSASSEKVLAPPVEIPMYHVRCECSTSIDKNLLDFRQYILWTLASVFPRKSPTGWSSVDIHQHIHSTVGNWRRSTKLSPTLIVDFHQ